MHVVEVLYDQTMVHPVESLAEVDASSQDSMWLTLVPCSVNKVEQFYQIMGNRKAFQATLPWDQERLDDRKKPPCYERLKYLAEEGSFGYVSQIIFTFWWVNFRHRNLVLSLPLVWVNCRGNNVVEYD